MASRIPPALAAALAVSCAHHAPPAAAPSRLPDKLPFTFTRPADGTPPTPDQVDAFTHKITGFFKQVDYFRWATWLAHGLDASYDPKMPDYALWWGQVEADKAGNVVTFKHTGTDDNLTIEMSKMFIGVASAYLATQDPLARQLVVGFSKGYSSFVMSMRWGDEAPGEYLWARTPFNHNHQYVTADGRNVAVDYAPVRNISFDWNAHTVPNNTNPFWGDIWVRNIRSQDDVPHILRIAPWLMRLVQDAPDADVRQAAQEALGYMQGFSADVVHHGYVMRSKEFGQVFIPQGDLVSYDYYDALLPNGECNAKISMALIGFADPLFNDCGNGIQQAFETVETASHYYNYAIVRYFHLSALANALVNGQADVAQQLLAGFAQRADEMKTDPMRTMVASWDADMASTILAGGATGLPLKASETQLIQQYFGGAVDLYSTWPYWDLWSASVPDGAYPYTPGSEGGDGTFYPSIQEMTYFFEYCQSPWRNPASVDPVDCGIILDPTRW
jgi:hypothetical protein